MKKIVSFILVAVLSLGMCSGLVGCGSSSGRKSNSSKNSDITVGRDGVVTDNKSGLKGKDSDRDGNLDSWSTDGGKSYTYTGNR